MTKKKSSSEAEQYLSSNCPHLNLFCSFILYKTNNENEAFASDPPHAQRTVTLQTLSVCRAQDFGHCGVKGSLTQHPAVPECWAGWDSPCSPCPLAQSTGLSKRNQVSVYFPIRDDF